MAAFARFHRCPRLSLYTGLILSLLAATASATIDRDNDGISDLWTALYPTTGPAAQDPDGDGATNLAEAIAGTDPTSPSNGKYGGKYGVRLCSL